MARIMYRKTFQPMWTQSCFKSGFWNAKKKGVLDRDPPRKPDSRTCECKALSKRDSCVCILKMHTEAMHKRMGQSARVDCAVAAKYYFAVRRSWSWSWRRLQCMWKHGSSNHDPNHVLDRDPKRLSERDSSPCEHSQCDQEWILTGHRGLEEWTWGKIWGTRTVQLNICYILKEKFYQ